MHWMGSFSTLLEWKTKKYSNLNWAAPSWLTLQWQCRRRRRHGSRSRGLNENKNIAIWLLSYLLLKMINSELEFAKYFVSTRSFDQIFITKLIFIQLITWIQFLDQPKTKPKTVLYGTLDFSQSFAIFIFGTQILKVGLKWSKIRQNDPKNMQIVGDRWKWEKF